MQARFERPIRDRHTGPVLVAGATGRTGRLIVDELVRHRIRSRALVRDAAKARGFPPMVQLTLGDLRKPHTLIRAMAGTSAAVIATCGTADPANSAQLVDFFGTKALMDAASAAGVGMVVYVSSIYATRPEHYQDVDSDSLGWKARGEEVVRQSGVPYCIVRAGWLTDDAGGAPLALSQGDVAEGHLSRADLADVCVQVLQMDAARGRTFEVVAAHDAGVDLEEAIAGLREDATQPI